jgi:formylglycine-generating enzyme
MRSAWSGRTLMALMTLASVAGCLYPRMHVEADDTSRAGSGGAAGSSVFGGGANSNATQGGVSTTAQPAAAGASSSDALAVPGGTFKMGRSESATGTDYTGYPLGLPFDDELPEHDVTLNAFALDRHEVTVGRFREFVEAYDAWRASAPVQGAGERKAGDGTGWDATWNAALPSNASALSSNMKICEGGLETTPTWTDSAADNEVFPINCVTWYEAFAFCVWDGGRLPTEAEWEYAAAGGASNRKYPWGNDDAMSAAPANFYRTRQSPRVAVGAFSPAGAGIFGHEDLAGSVLEWVFDGYDSGYYATVSGACNDCANVASGSMRVTRGGSWQDDFNYLRAAARQSSRPNDRSDETGFRCARLP